MGAANLESVALKCVFSGSTLKSSQCFTGNRSQNRWKKNSLMTSQLSTNKTAKVTTSVFKQHILIQI